MFESVIERLIVRAKMYLGGDRLLWELLGAHCHCLAIQGKMPFPIIMVPS